MLERTATWSEADQVELAEIVQEIERRRATVYVLSPDELADIEEGLAQADRNEFVPEHEVAKANQRHGI